MDYNISESESEPEEYLAKNKGSKKKTKRKTSRSSIWDDVEITTLLDAYVKYKKKLTHGNSVGFYSSIT